MDLRWARLARFALVFCAGWVVALAFHYVESAVFRAGYPWDSFLFNSTARYTDLLDSCDHARAGRPYAPGQSQAVATYFPAPYWLLYRIRTWARRPIELAYLGLTFGGALLVVLGHLRTTHARWRDDSRWPTVVLFTVGIGVLNYPLLFAVDRGNLDPLGMSLLFGGLAAAKRGHGATGGILVGLAASTKGFPLAAVLLWLRRGRFFPIAIACATTILLVVLPASTFEGGVKPNLVGLSKGIASFHQQYVVGDSSAHFSADWLNAIRIIAQSAGVRPDMNWLVPRYERFALVWASLLAFHGVFVAQEKWRQSLAVMLIMLVYPSVTGDYKLVFLLPAILAWISSNSVDTVGWRDRLFGLAAALLFVPKHFYFLQRPGYLVNSDASISCVINPLLVVALTVVLWPTARERAGVFENLRTFVRPAIRAAHWIRNRIGGRAGTDPLET